MLMETSTSGTATVRALFLLISYLSDDVQVTISLYSFCHVFNGPHPYSQHITTKNEKETTTFKNVIIFWLL